MSTCAAAVAVSSGLLFVGEACNVYTPDLLLSTAGAAFSGGARSSNGGSTTDGGGEYGGNDGNGGNGGSTVLPASSQVIGGNDSGGRSTATETTSTGGTSGVSGTSAPPTSAGAPGGGTGGVTAGAGAGGGGGTQATATTAGIAGGGATGTGGSTVPTCWLDDMRDQSGPIQGCSPTPTGIDYWYSFLPPAGSIGTVVSFAPSPSDVFPRQRAVAGVDDAIMGVGVDALWFARVRGQVQVERQDFGMGFKLNNGETYSLRGKTLEFYYRATYSSTQKVLKVNVPTLATVFKLYGGTCPTNCGNHYGYELPNTNGEWTRRSISFSADAQGGSLARHEGSALVYWNVDDALAIEFAVRDLPGPFDVSVGPIWLTWEG